MNRKVELLSGETVSWQRVDVVEEPKRGDQAWLVHATADIEEVPHAGEHAGLKCVHLEPLPVIAVARGQVLEAAERQLLCTRRAQAHELQAGRGAHRVLGMT
jgi:hypothetical protein